MTRHDELLLKSFDGPLDASERAELEALPLDPLLAELEGALRGERLLPDFGTGVLSRIRERGTERIMERVRATSPAWNRRRSRPWAVAAAALFLAALLPALGGPSALARVVEGDPDAVLLRGGAAQAAVDGLRLQAGDVLRTGARGIVLQLEGEATRLRIVSLSELALRAGKRIELREGEIEAEVAPQADGRPLVLAAAHATAEVLGTRLRLSAAPEATRLEVDEGRVRFVRELDGAALLVSARQFTVAAAEQDFVAGPLPAAALAAPRITGFSLIQLDSPRAVLRPLQDGDRINLAELPTRRLNVRADSLPDRVGSLRFAYRGREKFNTELVWPYTLVPNDGRKGPVWDVAPGLHTITATAYTGSYGNGLRGEPLTVTFTVVDEP